jgi:hypothetical protein
MKRSAFAAGALSALVAALVWSKPSLADEVVVAQPAPAPAQTTTVVAGGGTAVEERPYSGPDRRVIGSGLTTFALSYIPAVIVGATSDTSTDHHLFVPVVGPWLDLGNRPGCGPTHIGCDTETTYKVLLVVDGILQDIGVVTAISGLLMPERHEVVQTADGAGKADKADVRVTVSPTSIGTGYGMAALGSF